MFGYIMADEKQLSPEEVARYRKVYCGVCHSLKEQNGQLCRMTLTYDMTFLALLLNSLYEPLEHEDSVRGSSYQAPAICDERVHGVCRRCDGAARVPQAHGRLA